MQDRTGNILDDDAEWIVIPVNCVGVMGAGLALEFKQRYPAVFADYKKACESGKLHLGNPVMLATMLPLPQIFVMFPTKDHWKDKSDVSTIAFGMGALTADMLKSKPKSVAIPAVGCGLGGLSWEQVGPMLRGWFAWADEMAIDVRLYGPKEEK